MIDLTPTPVLYHVSRALSRALPAVLLAGRVARLG
jgi:hypothetical protein